MLGIINKITSNSLHLKPRLEAKAKPMEEETNSSKITRHKTPHIIRIIFRVITRLNSTQTVELASNTALVGTKVGLVSSRQPQR